MSALDLLWAVPLSVCALIEAYAIHSKQDGDTLSERTRDWFKVNTKVGRGTFVVSWVLFAVWFLLHIAFSQLSHLW